MMKKPTSKRLALLIDADNVQLSYVEHVLAFSHKQGQVDICRAYGDWKQPQLSSWHPKLKAQKIKCIQINRNGKNATDHGLLIDAGVILGSDPGIDVFVIVSGDGGFASAYAMIKQKGKQVIGIGNRSQTSTSLKKSCDRFYILEDLESVLSKLTQPRSIPKQAVREFSYPLNLAYLQLTPHGDWVDVRQLGTKLREVVPDYKSKFGKYPLSEWLGYFDKDFERREYMIRRINTNVESLRIALLHYAYEQTRGPNGLAHLPQLGSALRALDPDYKRHFGSKQLSKWLKAYPHVFTIHDENHVGRA